MEPWSAAPVPLPLRSVELDESTSAIWKPLAVVGLRRETREKLVGGKASKLAELLRAGLPVVPGWVLDAKVFQRVVDSDLPKGHDIASLIKLAGTEVGTDRAARARDRVLSLKLPKELEAAIEALWAAVAPTAPWGLSVRSSATCEDLRTSSLAGLATSVLAVRGADKFAEALRQVWASLYLPRTLLYLSRWNIRAVAMPVLVHRMVVTDAAGVMFTGPPPGLEGERWKKRERVIHATLGLGSPVVDGASAADAVRLDEHGAVIEEEIAEKAVRLVAGPIDVSAEVVPPERRDKPALSRATLNELSQVARELDLAGRDPLDVEFAVELVDGVPKLCILQARPVTGGLYPEGGSEDTVWSRANVGEALPGAATPLTWSVARRFADDGFRAAFEALGCKVPRGTTLVGNVYGRFYLNLTSFMRIAAQVPGLTPQAILSLSGGIDPTMIHVLERQVEGDRQTKLPSCARPLTLPKLAARQLGLEREVATFEADASRRIKNLREIELSILPDDALVQTLRGTSDLLRQSGELMLTCASASLAAHVALTALLARATKRNEGSDGDDRRASNLAQTLTGGISQLDSANPGIALLRVAAIARRDPEAKALIESGEAKSPKDLRPSATRAALLEFLETYGDRSIREAELATPRWREDPTSLMAMLAAALRAPPLDPDVAAPRVRRLLADRAMAKVEASLTRLEISAVRLCVGRTQHFTRLRERMRLWVTRTLGVIRSVALDVDRRLQRIDPSLGPGSVFFCEYEELLSALASGRAEIGHVVRLRRAEHLRDLLRPDPPAAFVGRPPPIALPPAAGTRLIGIGASSGVVEATARVLGPGREGLAELRAGEVLVARTTDVGLAPLFLVASGLVTELGGPLSHAAIVAREYGVPAVVNVEGATRRIKTGDRLRVDGDRGVVEKLGGESS